MTLPPPVQPLRLAVIGAGPVGLALALQAVRALHGAQVTLFDARSAEQDVSADPRTLALSLGSIQLLQRLRAWPREDAQPIAAVHVSQAPPTWGAGRAVELTAADEGVGQLGAVLPYGRLVRALQQAWAQEVAAPGVNPGRALSRFGTPVQGLRHLEAGVEVDAGIVEDFDLAVVAEGGVFAEQSRKALSRDYGQTAWVGTATLEGARPATAFERFTRQGPLALLPLPGPAGASSRAAMVWCVPTADDPVRALNEEQRLAVLNSLLPAEAGRLVGLSPLKSFALGLNAERTLVQGRQVRIGNAAQTLHPVAGQGLNLGLRDAFSLVQSLRFAPGVDAALRQVTWQRAADRWSMIATTDFLARSFTWHWPGVAAVRGMGLAALQAAPVLKHLLARQMMFGRR